MKKRKPVEKETLSVDNAFEWDVPIDPSLEWGLGVVAR